VQLARWSALAFLSILLIACSGSSKVRKPADLVNVTNQVELVEVWSTSVGSSVPANFRPVVASDHVFAASARGTLSKLNIQNGRVVWEVSVPEKLSIGPGSDGKTTVVISTEGNVYAYDEAGKNIWKTPIGSEVLSDPIVAAGVVVIRTLDNRFIGLDAANGKRRWIYQRQQAPLSLRVGYGMLQIGNDAIVTGFASGRFGAMALSNGGLIWESAVSFPKGFSEIERLNDVTSRPSLEEGRLCVVSYQGKIGCAELRTGNLVWSKDFSSYTGTTQSLEFVFAADEKSHVTAYRASDGVQVWQNTQLTWRDVGEPLAVGRVVMMGDKQGYVHLLNQNSGEMISRIRHDSTPVSAAPIAASGVIIIASQGGKIAAYRPR
jgi:outer membrane protein assembly factor BamB